MKNLLSSALQENNLLLDETAQQKLLDFLKLLQTWNRVFNLTAITEPREMIYLHIIDSLMVSPFLEGSRMLDAGTGAGLPGLPLAIISPQQHWVLLDKNNKKTRFLTQVIAELDLHNVEIIHSRSEDFHPQACFDNILSRAFGTLKMFAETTCHLLCKNGMLIALKGKYPQDELENLPHLFFVKDSSRVNIKGFNVERHIIRLKKDSHGKNNCGD